MASPARTNRKLFILCFVVLQFILMALHSWKFVINLFIRDFIIIINKMVVMFELILTHFEDCWMLFSLVSFVKRQQNKNDVNVVVMNLIYSR